MFAMIPCKYMRRYKVLEMSDAMTKKFTQKEQMHHEAIINAQEKMIQKSQTWLLYMTNKEPISVDDDLNEYVPKLVVLRPFQAASSSGSSIQTLTKKVPRNLKQKNLTTESPDEEASLSLTIAITDWVHSNQLPCNIVTDAEFQTMIRKAKFVTSTFQFWTHQAIYTKLLDTVYEVTQGN